MFSVIKSKRAFRRPAAMVLHLTKQLQRNTKMRAVQVLNPQGTGIAQEDVNQ
jgi:hypothetical protein